MKSFVPALEQPSTHSFQMRLAKEATTWINTLAKAIQELVHLFLAKATFAYQTVFSTIAQANQAAALFRAQEAQPLNEFTSKNQHSRHAKRRERMEEGFSSKTQIMANALFTTLVALTAHQCFKTVPKQMGNMRSYIQ